MYSKSTKNLGVTNCHHNLPFLLILQHDAVRKSGTQIQEPHSDSSVGTLVTMMSSGLSSFCCAHQSRLSGSHCTSPYFSEQIQIYPQAHINTGLGPIHNPVQGSFHLALVKVTLVPSCQNLSTADCSWASIFKKFRVKKRNDLRHYVVTESTIPLFLSFEVVISRSHGHAPQFLVLEDCKKCQFCV